MSEVRILSGPHSASSISMTIVFLCPNFYPHIGGVEKHALEVAKRLSKKGYKIIVITEGDKSEKFNIGKIEVNRFYFGEKGWFKKFKIWKKLLQKRKIIEKADIVHAHDVFFWYMPFRFLYPRKKIFTTFHGYETKFPVSSKAIFIRKLSERLSFGNICVGDFIKKWYGTKANFITYGAPDNKIKNKLNFKRKAKIKILFVGRIEEDTGVKIYAEALNLLEKSKLQFEACGDGSLRNELIKFGKVRGFVNDINFYILKSDIIFASSYLSIVEALSLGKPVISVYGNPIKKDYLEMSPFAKWITITKSPKILASNVESSWRKPDIRNIELAKSWAENQSWNKVTNLYLNLFNL